MVQIAILQGLNGDFLCCAPLLREIINRLKAIVQSRRGPSIWQPYRDLWKLLHKGSVVSEHASWVFHAAPIFSFITPLIVAMLIPVLTAYPLPYAFMGDMLAGGFIYRWEASLPHWLLWIQPARLVAWEVAALALSPR